MAARNMLMKLKTTPGRRARPALSRAEPALQARGPGPAMEGGRG